MSSDDLIKQLAGEVTPVKKGVSPFGLAINWLAIMSVYGLVALLLMGMRPDLPAKMQSFLFCAEILSLAGLVASSTLGAALLSYPDLYQRRKLLSLPYVFAALFTFTLVAAWLADNPPAPAPQEEGWVCLLSISLIALLPATGIFYAVRRMATTHATQAGCCAVLTAFGIGALLLRMAEETDSISHIACWHYLPMVAVAYIGMQLGKLLLKW
jgi:hypothetical protein